MFRKKLKTYISCTLQRIIEKYKVLNNSHLTTENEE